MSKKRLYEYLALRDKAIEAQDKKDESEKKASDKRITKNPPKVLLSEAEKRGIIVIGGWGNNDQ